MTNPLRRAFPKTLPVAASRGNIYDRYGRPLAVNTVAYCVQVDGSVTLELNREERKTLATDLTDWLWADGHHKVDSLPITTSSPYSFTFKGTDEENGKQEKMLEGLHWSGEKRNIS